LRWEKSDLKIPKKKKNKGWGGKGNLSISRCRALGEKKEKKGKKRKDCVVGNEKSIPARGGEKSSPPGGGEGKAAHSTVQGLDSSFAFTNGKKKGLKITSRKKKEKNEERQVSYLIYNKGGGKGAKFCEPSYNGKKRRRGKRGWPIAIFPERREERTFV